MPLRLLLAFLPTLLGLSSCIAGDEELWLNRDGSGRIEATYRMPPAIMNRFGGAEKLQKRLEMAIDNEPGIRADEISHHLEGTQVVFLLKADFDDARDFVGLPRKHLRDPAAPDTPSAEEAFFGVMNLKLSGLTLEFDRKVDLSPALPPLIRDNAVMLGNSAFRYTLHLPTKPFTHNANSTSNDGATLHWTFPLKKHANTPMLLQTSMPLPIPLWLWVLVGAIVLLLILIAAKLIKRKSRTT